MSIKIWRWDWRANSCKKRSKKIALSLNGERMAKAPSRASMKRKLTAPYLISRFYQTITLPIKILMVGCQINNPSEMSAGGLTRATHKRKNSPRPHRAQRGRSRVPARQQDLPSGSRCRKRSERISALSKRRARLRPAEQGRCGRLARTRQRMADQGRRPVNTGITCHLWTSSATINGLLRIYDLCGLNLRKRTDVLPSFVATKIPSEVFFRNRPINSSLRPAP